jgi:hypothetical protein
LLFLLIDIDVHIFIFTIGSYIHNKQKARMVPRERKKIKKDKKEDMIM